MLLCCIKEGGVACAKFVDERLRNKSSLIHSTISKIKFMSPKTALNLDSKADIKSETIKALMFIEYGCHWGFTVEELLQHEVTNSAFFLVDKDDYLRKSVKSQLGTELLQLCPLIDTKVPETSPQTNDIIIDFMALVRKIPLKKLDPPVKTFYDFAIALTSMVTTAGHNCNEIHTSSISKTAFQVLHVDWLTTNYQDSKPLYLNWYITTGMAGVSWVCFSIP